MEDQQRRLPAMASSNVCHEALLMESDRERLRVDALQQTGILDTLPEPQFDRLVRLAARALDIPIAKITYIDSDRQWFKAIHGIDLSELPRNESFCTVTIAHAGTLVVPDATLDSRFHTLLPVRQEPRVRFYAGAPLYTPEGHPIGTFCVLDVQPREFDREETEVLEAFAAMAMNELRLRQAIGNLRSLALHDALTGLPNRTQYRERLAHACGQADQSGHAVVLGLLDLDGFKAINDTLGHAAGDQLLQLVSDRLTHVTMGRVLVARIGGDEFALLFTDAPPFADVERTMTRVRDAFSRPFLLGSEEVSVRWSVGLSVYPDDSRDPEELLNQADSAMYQVKRAAAGGYAFYSASQNP
jgi:diguanylate cyclase (GGDEF)-like protein